MLFSFHCPACKGKLEADASLSGTQAECPECGKPVAIPEGRVDAGTTLAGFLLERRLGKGGMGEVYLARQLSVDRQVAVKILPPSFAADQQAVARFLQEGRLAARLDHHHIVTVHEAGEDSGNYYMAMAYVEGESLDQRLKRDGALPEAEALAIVRAVADALAYAWEEFQLLHRDLKPANIMLDRRGRVFLMDLGLAKSLGDGEGLTLSGTILGTPQYMSPEQALGHSDLGMATDIYSLGATLYHLVTGAPPFTGDSVLKILNQHVHEPLPPPRERNPQVSKVCNRLIEIMMAKKPEDRYGDWRALLADLDRILAHDGSVAPGQSQRKEHSAASPAPVQPPATPPKSLARQAQEALARQREAQAKLPPKATPATAQPSRRPWSPLVLGLAAAGFLVLVLLVALALRGRGGTPVADAKSPPPPTPVSPTSQTVPAAAIPAEGQPWAVPDLGMEFVWVKSLNLWVGKYEVTNGEYRRKEPGHDSQEHEGLSLNGDRQPVVKVNWDDAIAYAAWLTERERGAGRLPDGLRYRLPTENEFLAYAQCGDGRKYPWGNEWPPPSGQAGNYSGEESAWGNKYDGYNDGHPVTCDVEKSWANPWGLYGVGGNVWEGCAEDANPKQLFGAWRGACWCNGQGTVRCTSRSGSPALHRGNTDGFRLALSADSTGQSAAVPPAPVQGQGWTVQEVGMEFVHVEPGSFRMGSDGGDGSEMPVHEVRITRGYWLGKHEVTQGEYEASMRKNPSYFKDTRNPVEQVSWDDAVAFCQKLTERERSAGRLPDGYEYRLPTEAEWEYAAHGGTQSKGFSCAGSNDADEVAWYFGNSGKKTHPVGQRKPNELGFYDMSGNVWEWCHDWRGDYPAGTVTDPSGPDTGQRRVYRGGSWINVAKWCRAAARPTIIAPSAYLSIGFRVALAAPVLTPEPPPATPVAQSSAQTFVPAEGQPWTVPEIGMEFVWIKPLNLWVGKYEVTNGEYRKKEPRHDSRDFDGQSMDGDRQPVVKVNWDDAIAYAAWLTERERGAGRLPDRLRYRLPTEDEFMAYVQCGDGREYPWGNDWPPKSGQAGNYSGEESTEKGKLVGYRDGHTIACDVEKSWANPWGLYGVGGNVLECCAADAEPKQSFGAWCGGDWRGNRQDHLRCAARRDDGASLRVASYGFRLVLSR